MKFMKEIIKMFIFCDLVILPTILYFSLFFTKITVQFTFNGFGQTYFGYDGSIYCFRNILLLIILLC